MITCNVCREQMMSVVRQNLAADVIARAVAATDNISGFRGNIWKLLSELEDVGGATLVRLSSHVCLSSRACLQVQLHQFSSNAPRVCRLHVSDLSVQTTGEFNNPSTPLLLSS